MRHTSRILAAYFAVLILAGGVTKAADWPQFLGPDRNGISKETGLIDSWGASGPKELWRLPGGVGMAAVVVKGKLACTMIQTPREQQLLGFDAETGKKKWTATIAPNYRNAMGNGPRATPALSDEAAFVFTGEGVLARIDLKSGDVDWKVETVTGRSVAEYGMACSPILWGEAVIVTTGSRQATVSAFDQKSGEQLWSAGRNETAGNSTPAILKFGGKELLVVFAGASAFAVD